MTAFDDALKLTLGFEGGVSDHKEDRGGLTNFGVTQATYDRFRRLNWLKPRSVREIADVEVMAIYRDDYWIAARCNEMPARIAMCVFDSAVNHGPGRAIRLLQQALHVPVDGMFGPRTKAALEHADERETIRRFLDARQDFYDDIIERDPTQIKFQRGWTNRVIALRTELLNTEGLA